MRILNEHGLLRTDIHPLALLESEYPITECVVCELPVGEEMQGNIYCDKVCEDAALNEALADDVLFQMFPGVAPGIHCSCTDCC